MYKILIVEDDRVIADKMKEHLEKWDYEVACVQDFKRVQEEYTAFDPQLVIMDIILPFYNGFHWCTQIRQISSVPILFLSSANDNMNIVMAMNMGGDDFVEKPFDLNVLTAKIQALLRRAYSCTGQLNVLEYRDVIEYGAELSAIWLLFVGALNFWFYRKRYQSLLDLSAALPHELKEFPDPKSRIEAEYQEITETIFAWREMLENEVLLSKKDASDYYSLWVHQIKTPISAMHLLIQSFEEQAMEFEEHAEETLDFLNEMKMKIFQTEEYVGMVLSYLRMEDMGNDLKFQWYPIGDIMRQAVRKYSQIFILKKIHLNFQDSRQMVLTDEKWLLFVIEQILSNALKYTSSDEVRPPKAGSISLYIKGTELVVEDTGIGIAPEDLPRIFERGFTGYNGREHQKSTGIGLYLCKTIIQKLGHSIRAESRVGVGTKIYISLERENVKFE